MTDKSINTSHLAPGRSLARDTTKAPQMVYVVTNQHGVVLYVTRDKMEAMKRRGASNTVTAHKLED